MIHHRETGAALLTVLILVGVMGAIATTMFDRLRLATRLAGNGAAIEQARAFGLVGETLLTTRIDDLVAASPTRTTLAGGWLGRTLPLPLPVGTAAARVTDGGNCFNLNSLVVGNAPEELVSRQAGMTQFAALMRAIGVAEAPARRSAAAAADWIDSDDETNSEGAEDAVYARAVKPYRTAGTLMAEASELRAVTGVTAELYDRIRPWVCALPVAEMSPINVNTLLPAQAPLVAMLAADDSGLAGARALLARRPGAGWATIDAFWDDYGQQVEGAVLRQPQLRTQWFATEMRVAVADAELVQTTLVDARRTPARVVTRRWTDEQ